MYMCTSPRPQCSLSSRLHTVDCVRALLELLKAWRNMFVLNFGEKQTQPAEGWELLLDTLQKPDTTGVIAVFVDVVDAGGKKSSATMRASKKQHGAARVAAASPARRAISPGRKAVSPAGGLSALSIGRAVSPVRGGPLTP